MAAWGDNDSRVDLRIPAETRKALERLARKAREGKGLRLSEYIRDVLIDHADRMTRREEGGKHG